LSGALSFYLRTGRGRAGSNCARAVEYRRLAQQYLGLARSVSTEEARVLLVDMAARWLRLAEEQEDESTNVEPAAQQQQQVQPKDDDKKE
jgi:hypothetical protein